MRGFLLRLISTKSARRLNTCPHNASRTGRANRGFILAYSVIYLAFIMSLMATMFGLVNAQITITNRAIRDLNDEIAVEMIGERFVVGEQLEQPEGFVCTVSEDGKTLVVTTQNTLVLTVEVDQFGNIVRWERNWLP